MEITILWEKIMGRQNAIYRVYNSLLCCASVGVLCLMAATLANKAGKVDTYLRYDVKKIKFN